MFVAEGLIKEGDLVLCTHCNSNIAPGSTCVMKVLVANTKTLSAS